MSGVIPSCVDVPAICPQRSGWVIPVSETAAGASDVNKQQGYSPQAITAVTVPKGSEHSANSTQNLRQPSAAETQAWGLADWGPTLSGLCQTSGEDRCHMNLVRMLETRFIG